MIRKKIKPKKKAITVADYKAVFGTEKGRGVLADLMRNHYVLTSTYDTDPTLVALREGERNVVLRIMTMLKIDVEELQKRIEEIENQELDQES